MSMKQPVPYVHLTGPGLEAGLAEQRRLLVAEVARDRDALEVADAARRRPRTSSRISGSIAAGTPTVGEELRVPGQRLEVHQHRARGVRDVGHVDAATGRRRSAARSASCRWCRTADRRGSAAARRSGAARIEDPGELQGRRIGRDRQPGPCPEPVRAARPGRGQRARPPPRSGCPARRWRCGPAVRCGGPRRRWSRAGR